MTILITGINGFVGSNLVAALKNQYEIFGLDIISPDVAGIYKTYTWDQIGDLSEIDVVIHLAGKAHDTKNQTDAEIYFEVNTELTKKIYDWYLKSTATKFIFFSTVKAVADKVQGEVLTEDVAPMPVGPYGESKLAAENYLLTHLSPNEGKEVYIFRPCMIHGEGNKGNLNLLYKFVSKGIPYPLGAFENKRSFCSIDNLIYVVQNIISKDIDGGIYNICDDESVSTNELIDLINQSVNIKNKTYKFSKGFVEFIANCGSVLHLPFNNEKLQKLTENYVVSNQKIKTALKIESLPVSATDGLLKTIKSFNKI